MADEESSLTSASQIPDPCRAVKSARDGSEPVRGDCRRDQRGRVADQGTRSWPVARSQTRAVPSSPPVMAVAPSGVIAAARAACPCGR